MNPESQIETQSTSTRGVSVRMNEFLASRRGKMFGIAEVVALFGSCFVFTLVLLSNLYFLVPARSKVASLKNDRQQTLSNLETLDKLVGKETNSKETVDRIAVSLTDFESKHLLRVNQGRLDLYQELNQLILKNGVRNTAGPTYTTLDAAGTKSTSGKTVVTKWQSFYPGIAVMVTVEGEYQNVRHFIRDVERSKQFVVINEVELQRASNNNAPAPLAEGSSAGSGTRVSLVTLQLNMSTYFQRPGAESAPHNDDAIGSK